MKRAIKQVYMINISKTRELYQKRQAFDALKRYYIIQKKKDEYELYKKIERTFYALHMDVPYAIERWIQEK